MMDKTVAFTVVGKIPKQESIAGGRKAHLPRRMKRIAATSVLCILFSSAGFQRAAPRENINASEASLPSSPSDFTRSAACAGCHEAEVAAWAGSQHAHAMQPAAGNSVLGDFNNAEAKHFSSKARFFRKDGRFLVETEGKDGKPTVFEVKYTFGIDPLQQYLVEFPDGRLQALPYAWDTRTRAQGGQRWFHLYPAESIPASDPLYWTGPQQNWNYMCAECHSTNVRKNYDAAKDSFHTSFSEVSVGCEACHGPAADHLKWAASGKPPGVANAGFPSVPAQRGAVIWLPDPKTESPSVSVRVPAGGAMEACDRCHSRRGEFSESWRPGQPLAQTHLPAFLTSDLFEDDGQMRDEVFNTSSFRQSKMFAKGVVCMDCHDPHSGNLRAAKSEVCSQCHAEEKFAGTAHTGHAAGPAAPDCIACHMPARTYMVIDLRHDHSFRIPRPDLTAKIGTPNTCTSACHDGRDAAWAAAAVERWHGPVRKGFQTYAEAFHAARLDLPEARDLLLKVAQNPAAPSIARATALLELRERPSAAVETEVERGLHDADAMVRIGALRALEPLPLAVRWERGKASLDDPVRAVRLEAASLLADVSTVGLDATQKSALETAWQDYIAAAEFNADRAEERSNLGGFYTRQGKADLAEQEFLSAMRLAPRQVPPRVNLADLYRATGREGKAESLLRETVSDQPDAAAAHYALALSLIRQKRYGEAIGSLKRAVEIEPAQPRYAYVYAVALQSAEKTKEARQVLSSALLTNPSNVDILTALLQDALRTGDIPAALSYAERLHILRPDDDALARFTDQLKSSVRQN